MNSSIVRKIMAIAVMATLILQSGAITWAEELNENNTESTKETIKIGYYSGYNLINNEEAEEEKGYGYEVLESVESYTDYNFEYVPLTVPAFDAIEDGSVDVIGLFASGEGIEDYYAMSQPFGYVKYGLATKGDQEVYYDDPVSIDGKTVATFPNNLANVLLDEYLLENNISVNYVYDDVSKYTGLEADYYLVFSGIENIEDYHTVMGLENSDVHLYASKENQEIIENLDQGLSEILSEDGNFLENLMDKYMSSGENFSNRSLTRAESELLKGKTFKVGYIEDHKPYQYTDENGEAAGFNIKVMNNLAEEYGFEVEYHPYSLRDSVDEYKELDFLVSITGSSEAVDQYYDSTREYYSTPLIMLMGVKGDNSAFNQDALASEKSRIGTIPYLEFDYELFYKNNPNVELAFYSNFDYLLEGYEKENIDTAIFSNVSADYAKMVLGGNEVNHAIGQDAPMKIQVSEALGEEYVDIFNVILKKISNDEYYQILVAETEGYLPKITFNDFVKSNWVELLLAICIFAGIVVGLWFRNKLKHRKELVRRLNTDELTGLSSMEYFRTRTKEILNTAYPGEYEIISVDMDMFRLLNRSFGRNKGTEAIKAAGNALKTIQEKKHTAIIARESADKFIVLQKSGIEDELKVENLIYVESEVKKVIGSNYEIYFSTGVYKIDDLNESVSNMIDYANEAKTLGKGMREHTRIIFDEEMKIRISKKQDIIQRMDSALKNGEFHAYYQPKIDLGPMKIIGAEALVRWIPPNEKPIYPDEFIHLMENNGFISKIDLYIFEEVCKFIQENALTLTENGVEKDFAIAVNFSAATLTKPALLQELKRITKAYDVRPDSVEIEVTETAIGQDENVLKEAIYELKSKGFSIAMDDFGTGVSSFNRLTEISVDVLKLDKSLLDNCDSDKGEVILNNIISLAKELGLTIVAEGIETVSLASKLKEMNCDVGQGYYFAKPMPAKEFKLLLEENKAHQL